MPRIFHALLIATTLTLPLAAHAASMEINPRFERLLEDEAGDIERIGRGILFLQKQRADESGVVLRGTHSKGICAQGELTILDLEAGSPLKRGMFSEPGRYPTIVRFANAEGKIQPDQAPDVRAVSLAVSLPPALSNPQGRMDFAMNNAPIFPINDAHVFADILTIAELGILKGGWEIGISGLLALKETQNIAAEQLKPATKAYQSMMYWSNVPFQLGDDQAVKYALRPCAGNPAERLTADPDTLSIELKRHLNEDTQMSCFELQVQILNAQKMRDGQGSKHSAIDWVENATWEWNEKQAPLVTVGRLELIKNSDYDPATCEEQRIDVTTNNNAIHRGLGSINRARATGESASAGAR